MNLRSALFLVAISLPLVACSSAPDDSAGSSSDELGGIGSGGGTVGGGSGGGKAADCTKTECGPAPMIASQICADGTTAGPTCGRSAKGTCGWTITTCPSPKPPPPPPGPPTCDPRACGPALGMPTQICADGTTAGPTCEPSTNGKCGWVITSCPTTPPTCAATDCTGPRPLIASQLCKDGTTAGPTCAPSISGTCGWTITSCP